MDDWSNGGESAKGQVDISSMKKALWGPGSAGALPEHRGFGFSRSLRLGKMRGGE